MSPARAANGGGLDELSGTACGVRLRGRLPSSFARYLRPGGRSPAGSLEVRYREIGRMPEVEPIWSAEPSERTSGGLALFRQPGGFGLRVTSGGHGLFRITPREIAIEWSPEGPGREHSFFAYALPLWLESRGVPVLHASAVALAGRVAAFVGPSGIGKSTLCARFVRAGCGFVADDGLALFEDRRREWRAAPGPPLLRLWPSALERLGIPVTALPRVQDDIEKRAWWCPSGRIADPEAASGVAAVYVLEPSAEPTRDVRLLACSARESLILLIEHSLAGAPLAALGLSAERLERLSRLAVRAPVKRLRYPAATERWPEIRRAVADDLAANG